MPEHFCLACCTLLCIAANSQAALRFELPQIAVVIGNNQSASGFIEVVVRADAGDLPQSVGSFNVDFKTTSASLFFGIPQEATAALFSGTPQNFSPNAQTSRAARDIFPSSTSLLDNAGLVRVPFQTPVGLAGVFPLMFGSFNELTDNNATPLSIQTTDVGSITVTLATPGDYDHSGLVDAADFVVWRDTLGQVGSGLAADGNGNNQIDAGDYGVWKVNFGQTAGSGSSATPITAVPEPATLVMLMLVATGWCLRRGRAA